MICLALMKERSDAIGNQYLGATTVADISITGNDQHADPKLIGDGNAKRRPNVGPPFWYLYRYLFDLFPLICVNRGLTSPQMPQLVSPGARRG